MKHGMIYLLIAIPAASLVMGAVTVYLALAHPAEVVEISEAPLSKTSWRGVPDDR